MFLLQKTLALPPDFSCFVLFVGLCSKYYMVAERSGNTYYRDDVEGFIQEFFLGGRNVDACKGYACVDAPPRVFVDFLDIKGQIQL